MLARPKLRDGRPGLPDRPRRIAAAASKDHVGTGAPARPVERSSTLGAIAGAGCGASLRRADEGVRPYVDVLILPDGGCSARHFGPLAAASGDWALYSPYLLARNLPTSDSIWP